MAKITNQIFFEPCNMRLFIPCLTVSYSSQLLRTGHDVKKITFALNVFLDFCYKFLSATFIIPGKLHRAVVINLLLSACIVAGLFLPYLNWLYVDGLLIRVEASNTKFRLNLSCEMIFKLTDGETDGQDGVNPSKTKRRLLYLKTQFVPRSKHFSSGL